MKLRYLDPLNHGKGIRRRDHDFSLVSKRVHIQDAILTGITGKPMSPGGLRHLQGFMGEQLEYASRLIFFINSN